MDADTVRRALAGALGGRWSLGPLGASSFCETWQARGAGTRLFVKTASGAGAAMLQAEADGLQAIAATGTIRVPRVACAQRGLLAMEWLELVPPDAGFGGRFGRELAALHRAGGGRRFGWPRDNYLGATPQVNAPCDDWLRFFAGQRLGAMRDRLPGDGHAALRDAVDDVIAVLPAFFTDREPVPALIHGDLWQGNWGMLADGTPVIYDPAVSVSDPEAELAMMDLFGSVPEGFLQAYGLQPEPRRRSLYQLYHLLNHAVLFGGGYAQQALRVARGLRGGVR